MYDSSCLQLIDLAKGIDLASSRSPSWLRKLPLLHTLGWPRKSKTSQTDKYLWKTTFSHYLGQMNYRNAKKIKKFNFNIILASVKVLVHNTTMWNGANKKIWFFSNFPLRIYTFFFWIWILYEKCVLLRYIMLI